MYKKLDGQGDSTINFTTGGVESNICNVLKEINVL